MRRNSCRQEKEGRATRATVTDGTTASENVLSVGFDSSSVQFTVQYTFLVKFVILSFIRIQKFRDRTGGYRHFAGRQTDCAPNAISRT